MIRISLFLTCLLALFSCTSELSIEEKVAQAYNSTVSFPSGMVFTLDGKDSVTPPLNGYKIVAYLDSNKCIPCSMGLGQLSRFASVLDSVTNGRVPFLIIIHPDRLRHAKDAIRSSSYHYPVCIDIKDDFGHLNQELLSTGFSTFLLDDGNKVKLVGNPITNDKIRSLYLKTILGKDYDCGTASDIYYSTKSFGVFSWCEKQSSTIMLTNSADYIWHIDSLRTSCECTSATISRNNIEPHDTACVTITYKADAPGEFMREVYLDINGEEARLTLAVEGKAE